MNIIDRWQAQAPRILAIARFIAGVMFALHGAQKIFGLFGGMPPGVPWAVKWIAGGVEFFGGVLIAVGLFTRPAAFIASGLMAVAYFVGHAGRGFLPTMNDGELAVFYCWFFLFLSAHGPGAWALDHLFPSRRARAGDR